MIARGIPGTDLRVSPLCLGTALYGATIDTPTAYALLDAFVERGGTFLDTARSYNDWIPGERGRSEGLLGRWFNDRRCRQRMVLATKGGHAADDGASRLNARELARDVDASLAKLRIDTIDLYYLHRDDGVTPVASIIDALNVHVKAGKIRYLACSNWTTARIREANAYAAASGQGGFVANSPMWNAAVIDASRVPDRTLVVMDDPMWQWHLERGLACIPYSSQAGGLFAKLARPFGVLRARLGRWPAGYPSDSNLRRFRALAAVAAARAVPISHVVLAYLQAQPFVTVPIVGCRTVDQLLDSLAACDVVLEAAERQAINDAR